MNCGKDTMSFLLVLDGCLPGEHTIEIDGSYTFVVHPAGRVPLSLKEQIKEGLQRMEDAGVAVKQTEPTDWVNSMVTVIKPEKIRVEESPRPSPRSQPKATRRSAKSEKKKLHNYVGHLLTKNGLKPDLEKIRAVQAMTKPSNTKYFSAENLGFIQYLATFLPNMTEVQCTTSTAAGKEHSMALGKATRR
ncbi:Hypothetical predicted protein [Paramuricea clavata]|uniref:Uncharacterized protein n=1 Tax=Paramuricea clavata TaxID=317549 RepID=A0A6S7J4A3_PARCT|nr:Hypothetical predicted protein [Paramuricea clavata]